MRPAYVTEEYLTAFIREALSEDVGSGDVTSLATVSETVSARGVLASKGVGVVAGLEVASRVFRTVDSDLAVTWSVDDGDRIGFADTVGMVYGRARSILTAERLALNILQRMSGIATMTRTMADAAAAHGATILDTRKTAPGMRPLDKWAVLLGGGSNHRIGLYDMLLVKDNHITAAGGLETAIRLAKEYRRLSSEQELELEVEVRTLDEIETALEVGGIDVLLLDNMVDRREDGSIDTARLESAVKYINGKVPTEASGNVTPETVAQIAASGVNFISSGALTHSVRALDMSLEIEFTD